MLHFRGACAYCRTKQSRKIKLTRDHVVPVSKGGLTTRPNIVPACQRCNSSKSDGNWVEWYSKQAFYTPEQMEVIRRWVMQ
ncbi:MAG: HNH endonuclease [Bacteroidales bacterium]|nr:HNH endonuclease [Bacteroidales bacterium]